MDTMMLLTHFAPGSRQQRRTRRGVSFPASPLSPLESGSTPGFNFQPPQPALTKLPVRAAQAPPAKNQTNDFNDFIGQLIRISMQVGWEVLKIRWEEVSPNTRQAFVIGAKLATSPSLTEEGQKVGLGLCAFSLVAGLDAIEKASDD